MSRVRFNHSKNTQKTIPRNEDYDKWWWSGEVPFKQLLKRSKRNMNSLSSKELNELQAYREDREARTMARYPPTAQQHIKSLREVEAFLQDPDVEPDLVETLLGLHRQLTNRLAANGYRY